MAKAISFLKTGSEGKSAIFGAPDKFDFLLVLRNAVSIKCAVAFGHMSGWSKIAAALNDTSAKSIDILLGQAYFQTEPDLLDLLWEWEQNKKSFRGRLAPIKPTFHPKIWVIETAATTHVIIGSANLSHGGLIENTECSAYINDQQVAQSITDWFRMQWKESSPLNPDLRQIYRKQYDKTKADRLVFRKAIDEATEELLIWRREEAIHAAKLYFKTPEGKEAAEKRGRAMDRIRLCLKPPTFEFTKTDWLEFLRITEFGSLRRIDRDTANHRSQIRKAFLHLADERIPLVTRINEVEPTSGRFHVNGIGRNIVTKVMAMLHPTEMPVYNERVQRTLIAFGYPIDGSRTFGEQYRAFCQQLQSFVKDCGFSEVLSIDSFFEYYSRKK